MSLLTPNLPTATPVMQPFGAVSVYSTEQQIQAKSARSAAPTLLEVNQNSVCQQNSIATRGIFSVIGGATQCRQTTLLNNAATTATLTPDQLVDGLLIVTNQTAPLTLTLPTIRDLNAYFNRTLITSASNLSTAVTSSAPRTVFSLRIASSAAITAATSASTFPGHGANSGYWNYAGQIGVISTISQIAAGGNFALCLANTNATSTRGICEILFIQYLGASSSDPEWLVVTP